MPISCCSKAPDSSSIVGRAWQCLPQSIVREKSSQTVSCVCAIYIVHRLYPLARMDNNTCFFLMIDAQQHLFWNFVYSLRDIIIEEGKIPVHVIPFVSIHETKNCRNFYIW